MVKIEVRAGKLNEKYTEVLRDAPDDFNREEIASQIVLGVRTKLHAARRVAIAYMGEKRV